MPLLATELPDLKPKKARKPKEDRPKSSMLVLKFKVQAKDKAQLAAIDEAIKITQFIPNKGIRLWMDVGKEAWTDHKGKVYEKGISSFAMIGTTSEKANALTKIRKLEDGSEIEELAEFAYKLNAQSRGLAAARAWSSVQKFYDNCKKGNPGKKGYPKFQKDCRSAEWDYGKSCAFSESRKYITFNDKLGIGRLRLMGDFKQLYHYSISQFCRTALVRMADGYYCHFTVKAQRQLDKTETGRIVGVDVGAYQITTSDGVVIDHPGYYQKVEQKLKRLQRIVSRRKKGSCNRRKAVVKLGRFHLKIQRRRKDFLVKTARALSLSSDKVFLEDLKLAKMAQSKDRTHLRKKMTDAANRIFRQWMEYYASIGGAEVKAIQPDNTRIACSQCGCLDESVRTLAIYACKQCGMVKSTGRNSAENIYNIGAGISC